MSNEIDSALGLKKQDEESHQTLSTNKVFYEPEEKEMACLGRSYLSSFLTEGSISKSVLLVSQKRLYQKGSIFEKSFTGKLTRWDGQSVIPLDAISGTSYRIKRAIGLLIMGWIAIIVSIFAFIGAQESEGLLVLAIPALFFGVLWLIAYGLSAKEFFVVSFAGGELVINTHWYSRKEMNEFQQKLHQAREMCKS
ncbi:hypothetical protein JW835_15705 [bacterium]|nr:hypothetical protein [bacterium]